MEVLLVRLAGGSASFCRLGQGGLDAKCDRAGVLQALWAVPSTLEGKTRRKHSNTAQKEKKRKREEEEEEEEKEAEEAEEEEEAEESVCYICWCGVVTQPPDLHLLAPRC